MIAVTDLAIARGWAPEVALGLARSYASRGEAVMLLDGDLEVPSLHESLGLENGPGLADVLLFGSSVDDVAHAAEDNRFQLLTAGSAVGDVEAAYAGERWRAVCAELSSSGTVLLVFAPAERPWSSVLLAPGTDVIVLATDGEEGEHPLTRDDRVRAILGVPLAGSAEGDDPPGQVELVDPPMTDPLERLPEAGSELPEPFAEAESATDSPEDDPGAWEEVDAAFREAPEDLPPPMLESPAPPAPGLAKPVVTEEAATDRVAEEEEVAAQVAEEEEVAAQVAEEEEEVAAQVAEDVLAARVAEEEEVAAQVAEETVAAAAAEEHTPDPLLDPTEILERTPSAASTQRGGLRRHAWAVAMIAGVAAAAVLFGPALGRRLTPDATETAAESPEAERLGIPTAEGAEEAEAPVNVIPLESHLRFSVALAAYGDPSRATTRLALLREQSPNDWFALAPVEVSGQVFQRLLAGLAIDLDAVARVTDELATALGESSAPWVVRDAGLAFELGRHAEPTAAAARVAALTESGIPAYVLAVRMSDGSVDFRVYVGGYADRAEATYAASLLESRGYGDAELVQRIGTFQR